MPYGVQCASEAESSRNMTAIIRPGLPCKRGHQASEHGLQEGVWCIILHALDCLQWQPLAAVWQHLVTALFLSFL